MLLPLPSAGKMELWRFDEAQRMCFAFEVKLGMSYQPPVSCTRLVLNHASKKGIKGVKISSEEQVLTR